MKIWRGIGCVLLVCGVVVLVSGALSPFFGMILFFPIIVDFCLRVVFPSEAQKLVSEGRCPSCGVDVSSVEVGVVYCPSCGEVLPAGLRKYG